MNNGVANLLLCWLTWMPQPEMSTGRKSVCRYSWTKGTAMPIPAMADNQPAFVFKDWLDAGHNGSEWPLDKMTDSTTLASLLKRIGTVKALSNGRLVHARISRLGNDHHTFVGNCIVEMYGNCGSVEDAIAVFNHITYPNLFSWNILLKVYVHNGSLEAARSIFSRMPQRDIVSWNAMIAAYAQDGRSWEALDLFSQMQLKNVKPDTITFVCALTACASAKALDAGKEIHVAIGDTQHAANVAVGNALVNMYGKCGLARDAWSAFSAMHHRDVVSWTTILSAFAENGHAMEALNILHLMQLEGISPDNVAFMCALDACAKLAAFEEGQRIHCAIVERGCGQDFVLATSLINMYGKCGSIVKARTVFSKMPYHDAVSWKTMLAALVQNGHGKDALDLFYHMQLDGFRPDDITFVHVLDACTSMVGLEKGQEIHVAIIESAYGQDTMVQNALVTMYGNCGSAYNAKSVFGSMHQRDVISWNAMMAAFAHNGYGTEAIKLFYRMQVEGFKPDVITFVSALSACAFLTAFEEVQDIHVAIVKSECTEDVIVGNALINCYAKCGNVQNARCVFSKMLHCDVVTWTAMIEVYVQNGHGEGALDLFHQMQLEGIKPNDMTLVFAIEACANLAALEAGQAIHASIMASKYGQDIFVGTALINMYGKCGSVHDAKSVFGRLPQWNLVSCTAMVAAFAHNGCGKEALDLFCAMQLEDIKPDNAIFTCVLTACSHTGLVDDGSHVFLSITSNFRTLHTTEHYVCLIDLLGRAGQLEEAEDLITNIPFGRAALAWRSLLSACRIHGDAERTERAARWCAGVEPN